jgi:two-component system, OmpR family, phosphate regulon sensor histidine kinase PhoR
VRTNLVWQWILAIAGLLLVVVLGLSLASSRGVSEGEFLGLAGIGCALFLMVFLSSLSSESYRSRVRWLVDVCRRVAAGDFPQVEPDSHSDELAALGRALRETSDRLKVTIASLRAGQSRTAAILDSMAEGVAVVGADERVVFSNEAFAQILGLGEKEPSAGQIAGHVAGYASGHDSGKGLMLVELVRQSELLVLVKKALAERRRVESDVTVGTLRPRTFAVTAAPVEATRADTEPGAVNRETLGAVLVLHDISELRRLERVRRDFVANVSHEFKTPLTAIRGFAETLLAGALDDADHRARFVEIIREHAERLTHLTDDLLRLSKMEAGQLALEFKAVDASELLLQCLDTARFGAEQKKLKIELQYAQKMPPVRGDAARLRDVIQNLLDNAVQYTPAGGRIVVSANTKNGDVVFDVSDNGIGIPQADLGRIFERFYRVDDARSREAGGTGLGLAIAKHIVEAHSGKIWVESRVGEGSSFHFSIPIAN